MKKTIYIDSLNVRELIERGDVIGFPNAVSLEAETALYAAKLPWRRGGGLIDWSNVPNSCVCSWMQSTDAQVIAWATKTTAGRHSMALLLYNSDEPCLIGDFVNVIGILDRLVWRAPGPRLIFGTNFVNHMPQVSNDIIEYNGVDQLFGVSIAI